MILPTKGIAPNQALIAIGARVLKLLDRPKTVSRLWDEFRTQPVPVRFDWFVLGLDLLYLLGAIKVDRGRLYKTNSHDAGEVRP